MPHRSWRHALHASRAAARRSVTALVSSVLGLALAAVATAALLAATPGGATAQSSVQATTNAPWAKGAANPCVSASQVGAGLQVSSDCTGWSEPVPPCFGAPPGTCSYVPDPNAPSAGRSEVHASASNQNGQLRVSASARVVTTTGTPAMVDGMGLGWRASAEARWSDVLRITSTAGAQPTSVLFDVWYHGEQAVRSAGFPQEGPIVCHGPIDQCGLPPSWMMQGGASTLSYFTFSAPGAGLAPQQNSLTSDPGRWSTLHRESEQAILWPLSVPVGSSNAVSFTYTLRADASVAGGILDNQHVIDAAARADYGNTAGLRGVRFLDAQGNDVTAQVSYTFDRGTQLLPQSTVPEPATLGLCAVGLALVGGIARRRRVTA
jgi:hypothetical protein